MERINAQLSQKEKISDFSEMERKMKKLQRKYNKVSESNNIENQKRTRDAIYIQKTPRDTDRYPDIKHEGHTLEVSSQKDKRQESQRVLKNM